MKYELKQDDAMIEILVSEVGDRQADLMAAFSACRQGRCVCPTQEYQKLESLEVEPGGDSIRLVLRARAGESLDPEQIERCLDYTRRAIEAVGD